MTVLPDKDVVHAVLAVVPEPRPLVGDYRRIRRALPGPALSGDATRLEGRLRPTVPALYPSLTAPQHVWAITLNSPKPDEAMATLRVHARDAMPAGGSLAVVVSNMPVTDDARPGAPSGGYAAGALADPPGSGVDPALLPQVLGPFFTTKSGRHGAGSSLASVCATAKGHGDRDYVDATPDQGPMLTVLLPRYTALRDEPPDEEPYPGQGAGELILVVDDDDDVRAIVSRLLQASGYEPLAVAGPDAALDVCRARGTDIRVLITDVSMPGMSGYQLAERVAEGWPRVRILVASGFGLAEPGEVNRRLASLPKPFDRLELARAVQALLHPST